MQKTLAEMVKRGDLVMWDGGRSGNKLSGVVLSVKWYPADWQGRSESRAEQKIFEYLTVRWQTGKVTTIPAKHKGLEVISECR
jgi:hypothetical protein